MFVREITAFPVGDGDAEQLVPWNAAGERRVEPARFQEDLFAVKLKVAIPDERAR